VVETVDLVTGRLHRRLRWAYLVPWATVLAIVYGFRRELPTRLTAPPARPEPRRRPSPAFIFRAATLGARIAPVRSTCLVRALVAVHILDRFGYSADIVIGVPRATTLDALWRAHAWVEVDPPGSGVRGFDELARIHA
jgi:transglutaminase superfamily protein